MPRHFCLCFSLKTGAITMSFITLLLGAVEIVAAIIQLSNPEERKFQTLVKHVDVFGNACNATRFCNETVVEKIFPKGESGPEGIVTLFTVCLLLGILSVCSGVLLLIGMIQAKEKYILWYVLLGSVALFIVTIYSGIHMFNNGVLALVFILSIYMWFGQVTMYHFYEEVAEYNTVKSGAIEISYNGNDKSYANSVVPTYDVDNTAV